MRHKLYTLDRIFDHETALRRYREENAEHNGERMRRLRAILPQVIAAELTDRQREVLHLYFYEDHNIPEIAAQLALNKSTVQRHLKAAMERIRRILRYSV